MERALSLLLSALEAALSDLARERIARLREDEDAAEPEVAFARHVWLFGPSARDLLGEVAERGLLPDAQLAALHGHLARLAHERAVIPMRRSLAAMPERALDLESQVVSLRVGLEELSGPGDRARHAALERTIARMAERVRGPVAARLDEADEAGRSSRPRAEGDVDRIEPDVGPRALAVLDETDELADEVMDFLRGRIGGELKTPFALQRSLRAAELDDLVPLRTRATRIAELLRPARLDERLRRARVERSSRGLGGFAELVLPSVEDVRIIPSEAAGIVGEIELVEATGRALAVLHAHPGAPSWLRRPRSGVLGRIVGAMLARAAFETRALARPGGIPVSVLDRGRRVAAATMLFRLRAEAARTLASLGHDATEGLSRALRVEVPEPIAAFLALSRSSPVRFDTMRLGLSFHRAMRERFDEGYLQGRDAPEVLRSMLGRVTLEPPSRFALELEVSPAVEPELRGFFEGRLR